MSVQFVPGCDDWDTGHYGQRPSRQTPTTRHYCLDCGGEVEWDVVSDGWYCPTCREDKDDADVSDTEPDDGRATP